MPRVGRGGLARHATARGATGGALLPTLALATPAGRGVVPPATPAGGAPAAVAVVRRAAFGELPPPAARPRPLPGTAEAT